MFKMTRGGHKYFSFIYLPGTKLKRAEMHSDRRAILPEEALCRLFIDQRAGQTPKHLPGFSHP